MRSDRGRPPRRGTLAAWFPCAAHPAASIALYVDGAVQGRCTQIEGTAIHGCVEKVARDPFLGRSPLNTAVGEASSGPRPLAFPLIHGCWKSSWGSSTLARALASRSRPSQTSPGPSKYPPNAPAVRPPKRTFLSVEKRRGGFAHATVNRSQRTSATSMRWASQPVALASLEAVTNPAAWNPRHRLGGLVARRGSVSRTAPTGTRSGGSHDAPRLAKGPGGGLHSVPSGPTGPSAAAPPSRAQSPCRAR